MRNLGFVTIWYLTLVSLKHSIMKLLSFLALSISGYVLGLFGLGLGHVNIWPLPFLAKLALHNTGGGGGGGGGGLGGLRPLVLTLGLQLLARRRRRRKERNQERRA